MEFKKLADVNLLESAPENATAFAEVNGEVVRVKGGVGGSSYTYDFTDKLIELFTSEEPAYEMDEGMLMWIPTWEEAKDIVKKAMNVDDFKIKIDMGKLYKLDGENISDTMQVLASYSGQMVIKSYDEQNHYANLMIGYYGLDVNSSELNALILFNLVYNEEDDSSPMAILAMPFV